ncbi:MAG: tandem-95 repeat protein [Candidatus Cloacimonetes bacterium]|nr:tandem-95 repeat protein [Candidatus Cloacimonadota bacterium]
MKRAVVVLILLYVITLAADFPRPWVIVFYTNSTVAYCQVTIDGEMAVSGDEVGAFVDSECRGVGEVIISEEQAICSMNIQGNVIEEVEFAVWDASEDQVCVVNYTTNTLPGGDIGYPPNLLPINAISDPNQNLAPVWSLPAEIEWAEDSNYNLNLNAYASDPEGNYLVFICLESGDLEVNISMGHAVLVPAANYFGSCELVFSASDGENISLDTLQVTVTAVNDLPVVFISDIFSFAEDTELIIDLTEYVTDIDNDDLEITISNNYHIQWYVDGMLLTLSGQLNWNGMENLLLSASDGEAADSDNFMVIVTPVNDAPQINLPAAVAFNEDTEHIVNLNNYSSDPDGESLNYSYSGGDQVNCTITGNYLILSAEADWNGEEYILITATDAASASDTDTLQVIVNAVNDAPQIDLPVEFTFAEDSQLVIDFGEYVSDVDGDELSLLVSGNSQINVQMSELEVTFSASANWWGEEQLQFTVNDGQIRAIASDQVLISVNSVNDAPILNLPAELSFYSYSQLTENFSSYISDPENDDLTLAVSGNDSIFVEINGLNVTFSAEPGWFGIEELSFSADDSELVSTGTMTVEVLEPSELPDIILPETISFDEDTELNRDFSIYIFNSEGFDLALTSAGNAQIVVVITDYSVNFSAPADWSGTEAISFVISDNMAGFETFDSVVVNVNPVNDAPQLDLPEEISFEEDSIFSLDCAPYITDIDNEEFTLSVTGNQMILVSIAGTLLNLSGTTDYYGTEQLYVTVNDNSGRALDTDTLIVNVEPVNDIPVLNFPAEILFNEDEVYQFAVNDYIYDADADSLEIIFSSDFGCEFLWQAEAVNLIPPADHYGDGLIIIDVSDGIESLTGEIEVTIFPINDAPVLELPDNFTFAEDEVFSFDFSDYASDVDGDNLQIEYAGPFFIFVDISGTIVELQPLSNWNGIADMTFTVSDGILTASDEVEIIVEAVNDMPNLSSFSPEQTELLFYGETGLDFSVNVYDNDSELNYIWYINGLDQGINAAAMQYNFLENGEYTVLVEISDEEYLLTQQWQVTIYSGPGWELVVYTNSTVIYSEVTIDNEPAEENDLVGAFINGECRGIGEIVLDGDTSHSSFLIQSEAVETVNFMVYSAADEAVYSVLYTTQTNPGGDLGYPPDNLIPLAAYTTPGPGWVPVDTYDNWTTVYSTVTIDGEMAADSDVVGAFAATGECLGLGTIIVTDETAYCTIDVFQDVVAEFSFKVWDASANDIYEDYTVYNTIPQGQIGEPGSEIEIAVLSITGPGWEPEIYTNSTTAYFVITLDTELVQEEDLLGVFVEDECRGTGSIIHYEGESISTIEIQGEAVETCSFRLWDASAEEIFFTDTQIDSEPGGEIGYPPDEIELNFWSYELPEYEEFPRPWNVVYYTNSTVAYGSINIDDQPVTVGNEIASFAGSECRGLAEIVINDGISVFTMNIQGDVAEAVQFNYYDVMEDQIYSVEYFTITNPGGDIGYPPNLLPLNIYTNFAPEVNLPPGFSFDEDEVVVQDMSEYITDPDGDELILSFSGNEQINISIDGMIVTAYGDENWNGTETINYSVDDGNGHIVTGTLVLEVLPVNDPPDISLPYSFTLQEDQELTVDFSTYINDIEGDEWFLTASATENITVSINESMVTLTPDANWNGQETITFTADDYQDSNFDDLIVIVNPQPDAPIVNLPDQFDIYENTYLTISIAEYISDPDGDDFSVYATNTDEVSVVVSTDSITIMPNPDWWGTDTITINADDSTMRLIGSDDVIINVIHVHQPPDLFLPEQFMIDEDSPENFDLSAYYYLYEGEEFAFSATGNDSIILTFEGDILTIAAPLNWNGMETVVFTLDDEPARLTVSDTVNIIVTEVNDEPEIVNWQPYELDLEVIIDSTITFSVVVEDVEGGIGYNWYLNGVEQPDIVEEYTVTFDAAGEYEVECMAYDETAERYKTWNITATEVDNDPSGLYAATALTGNYPNPFNPETAIRYCVLAEDLPAVLKIFNLKGQNLKTWQISLSGSRQIVWDGCDDQGKKQASGFYIYQLQSGAGIDSSRMLLLK